MTWLIAHVYTGEERATCERLRELRRLDSWRHPLIPGYVFVDARQGHSGLRDEVPTIIRFLPHGGPIATLSDDAMLILQEICRAEEERQRATARNPNGPRGEPIIAGFTRTALANHLRSCGVTVTFRPEPDGRVDHTSSRRSNAGHQQRRRAKAA